MPSIRGALPVTSYQAEGPLTAMGTGTPAPTPGPIEAVAIDGLAPRSTSFPDYLRWSFGFQLVIAPKAQGPLVKPFSVLGWTLAFSYALFLGRNAGAPPFVSKLGKMIGGVVLNMPVTAETPTSFFTLPDDLTGITTLFDPATDAAPPQQGVFAPTQPTDIKSYSLPQPMVIEEGSLMQFGLWQFPQLSQNAGIALLSGQYTIIYQEGV